MRSKEKKESDGKGLTQHDEKNSNHERSSSSTYRDEDNDSTKEEKSKSRVQALTVVNFDVIQKNTRSLHSDDRLENLMKKVDEYDVWRSSIILIILYDLTRYDSTFLNIEFFVIKYANKYTLEEKKKKRKILWIECIIERMIVIS